MIVVAMAIVLIQVIARVITTGWARIVVKGSALSGVHLSIRPGVILMAMAHWNPTEASVQQPISRSKGSTTSRVP
jgi:hypothetical protein